MKPNSERDWALALYHRSVRKQAKFQHIAGLLGDTHDARCLDVGGDNGVISLLLRKRGGDWTSADLEPGTVDAIRRLVGGDVHQIGDGPMPFGESSFDLVVIVDFLEHITDDAGFVQELTRVLRPGGTLFVNVPHEKPRSLLNRIRHRIGLTDAWHGHLRPGYSIAALRELLHPWFWVEKVDTYSGSFSEMIDTLLNGWYLRANKARSSAKGQVVTGGDIQKHRKQFRLLSLAYPLFWLVSRLDRLLVFQQGYKLIVKARLAKPEPELALR
jgi:SAM-dependent methyltransferase